MNEIKSDTIKLTFGHIVKDFAAMKSYCGTDGYGWDYGTVEESTCSECVRLFSK